MKLLFAIKTMDSRGGGAERVLAQLTSSLAERGHEVTLVSFDALDSPDFYRIDPAVKRVWLNAGRGRARTNISDLVRRVVTLRRTARAVAPDAAVGFMHSAYVPLALAAAGTRTPVIASEHTAIIHFAKRPLELALVRLAARLAASMTIPSEAVRAGFPAVVGNRMTVIPNPVIKPHGSSSEQSASGRHVLLAVGRLSAEKRHAMLVDAFARVASGHPEWVLRIVGDGDRRGELEKRASALGIAQRVELPGATAQVEEEYARADLFVVPSLYESFGIATAEALAAGLPAVGFADCPGTNELIRDGLNGLLVTGPGDVSALAETLERLMAAPDQRRRLAAGAAASVAEFELLPIVDRWERLLGDVAASAKGTCSRLT